MSYYVWKPYVPVARRRAKAEKEMKKLAKGGKSIEPVVIDGLKIARTFWGGAWCSHLEKLSDFANRLPRGRTYVRNGSVCHLGIDPGRIEAVVSGSELYRIEIKIDPLPQSKWKQLSDQCTGKIGSALELLQGKLSKEVMQVVTDRDHGLFPKPGEIHMECSCPDWAGLCKHLAAVLYGVGARLDSRPELLFQLRGVDPQELITADLGLTRTAEGEGKRRRLAEEDLSGLFGVEIEDEPMPAPGRPKAASAAGMEPHPEPARGAPVRSALKKEPARPGKPQEVEFVPTGPAVLTLRTRLGLNKTEFALLTAVTPTTIAVWEKAEGALNPHHLSLYSLRTVALMTPEQAAAEIAKIRSRRRRR